MRTPDEIQAEMNGVDAEIKALEQRKKTLWSEWMKAEKEQLRRKIEDDIRNAK